VREGIERGGLTGEVHKGRDPAYIRVFEIGKFARVPPAQELLAAHMKPTAGLTVEFGYSLLADELTDFGHLFLLSGNHFVGVASTCDCRIESIGPPIAKEIFIVP
jgi:hypothetical protein